MCIEIEVPTASLVAETAWIRTSRGVTQWARPSSDFAPEMDARTDGVFRMEEQQSPRPSQRISELCIGRPMAFHSQTLPGTTARPIAPRPARFRQVVHRAKNDTDNSEPLDIPVGERRWYVVGYSERKSNEPKTVSR